MQSMSPLVSVIVPVYNSSSFINEALLSVEAAMGTLVYEIIVVNDGSTDDIEAVLQPWMSKISYISQTNQGAAAARNVGIKKALGTYIAFLDADDMWAPNHMTVLLNEFTKKSTVEIAMGCLQRFWHTDENYFDKIFYGGWDLLPSFGASVIRKDVFQNVGMIEVSYRLHEDVDWFLRAVESQVIIATVPKLVSYYRVHMSNTTHDLQPTDRGLLRVLAASLKRRDSKEIASLREIGI